MWIELTRKFGFQTTAFTPGGILVPAESEEDEARIVSGYDAAKKFQLSTRILDHTQIHDLVPKLAGSWRCGLFTPGDAHADPQVSTLTIARAAREAGVSIFENEPVNTIDCPGGAIAHLTNVQRLCQASVVVLAAGIGTPALACSIGIHLPIQVVRSSVAQTLPVEPFTKLAMWAPKASYRPRPDGSLTIGNGYRGVGADYDLTISSLRHLAISCQPIVATGAFSGCDLGVSSSISSGPC